MVAEVTMTLAEANHVLRLSDSQLAIVRQAAVPLSPSARDRYPSMMRRSKPWSRPCLHARRPMKQEAAMPRRYDDDFDERG
jgi:hypothetical protein